MGVIGRGHHELERRDPVRGGAVIKAMAHMVDYRIRTIPIVTDSTAGTTVVGVVSRRDLASVLTP